MRSSKMGGGALVASWQLGKGRKRRLGGYYGTESDKGGVLGSDVLGGYGEKALLVW